jgi:hypothetical protein
VVEFLRVPICSTTLSAMYHLFYYTECSFLLVSFFLMILMPWISIAVVFKCVKLWYWWCVINKITYIFCICKYFSAILVYVLYRWAFLNEKWAILSAMPCDRLNYHPLPCDRLNHHPLPCDRLNWHMLLNQWEDRKFTWNIIIFIINIIKLYWNLIITTTRMDHNQKWPLTSKTITRHGYQQTKQILPML